MELTSEQLWIFDCKGFVIINNFVAPSVVSSILAVAKTFQRNHYSQDAGLLDKDLIFHQIVFHPGVDKISCQFFGDYRLKGSVLVINPAQKKRTGGIEWPSWHQDADHGSHSYYQTGWPCPLFQLRFFIALSEVTCATDGGLALYPGSHRSKLSWPFDSKSVPVGCEIPTFSPGDCMIMHHATVHTALPNRSNRDRINIQVLTTPPWIRSNEAESISEKTLDSLTKEQQQRLIRPEW